MTTDVKYGVRINGTELLLHAPLHMRNFRRYDQYGAFSAYRFDTLDEAKKWISDHLALVERLSAVLEHAANNYPTDLEVVVMTVTVAAVPEHHGTLVADNI